MPDYKKHKKIVKKNKPLQNLETDKMDLSASVVPLAFCLSLSLKSVFAYSRHQSADYFKGW